MTDPETLTICLTCEPDDGRFTAWCADYPYRVVDRTPDGAIIRLIRWLQREPSDAC